MEKFMLIKQVFPTQERPYKDKNGNDQVFASKTFVLTDGIDTVVAEMQGDLARANAQTQYDMGALHAVQMQCQVRQWRDQQGVERMSNEVRIIKLV